MIWPPTGVLVVSSSSIEAELDSVTESEIGSASIGREDAVGAATGTEKAISEALEVMLSSGEGADAKADDSAG